MELILIIVLVLLFGGGGYWGRRRVICRRLPLRQTGRRRQIPLRGGHRSSWVVR